MQRQPSGLKPRPPPRPPKRWKSDLKAQEESLPSTTINEPENQASKENRNAVANELEPNKTGGIDHKAILERPSIRRHVRKPSRKVQLRAKMIHSSDEEKKTGSPPVIPTQHNNKRSSLASTTRTLKAKLSWRKSEKYDQVATLQEPQLAKALYNYSTGVNGDLAFEAGHKIWVDARIGDDWLRGYVDGTKPTACGIFPCAYVEFLTAKLFPSESSVPQIPTVPDSPQESKYSFEYEHITSSDMVLAEESPNSIQLKHQPPALPKPKEQFALVKFSFPGDEEGDLGPLEPGMEVEILRDADEAWYYGRLFCDEPSQRKEAKLGIFPKAYVELFPEDDRFPIAVARCAFQGELQGQLQFKKGQTITVFAKLDEHWMRGGVDGRQGLFPSSYVVLGSLGEAKLQALAQPPPVPSFPVEHSRLGAHIPSTSDLKNEKMDESAGKSRGSTGHVSLSKKPNLKIVTSNEMLPHESQALWNTRIPPPAHAQAPRGGGCGPCTIM